MHTGMGARHFVHIKWVSPTRIFCISYARVLLTWLSIRPSVLLLLLTPPCERRLLLPLSTWMTWIQGMVPPLLLTAALRRESAKSAIQVVRKPTVCRLVGLAMTRLPKEEPPRPLRPPLTSLLSPPMAPLMTHRQGPPEEQAGVAGHGHTKHGLHSARVYTAGMLRPVRTWERAMGLMVRDVASKNSSAQGWSGGIRAGLTTQRPWRRNSYAPNVKLIPAPTLRPSPRPRL